MNKKQEFLEILTDPDAHYLRQGVAKFKEVLHEQMFDYKAEFLQAGKSVRRHLAYKYCITVRTDDQDALDDLDKHFTLCFANSLGLVAIKPMQFSDTFERRYFIVKDFRRG